MEPYDTRFVLSGYSGENNRLAYKYEMRLLNCITQIQYDYLIENPSTPSLYRSNVYYFDNPGGREVPWFDIGTAIRLGYADCKTLTGWRVAELMIRHNVMATPDFVEYRTAEDQLFHAFVRLPDGRTEDPSALRGMKRVG